MKIESRQCLPSLSLERSLVVVVVVVVLEGVVVVEVVVVVATFVVCTDWSLCGRLEGEDLLPVRVCVCDGGTNKSLGVL